MILDIKFVLGLVSAAVSSLPHCLSSETQPYLATWVLQAERELLILWNE